MNALLVAATVALISTHPAPLSHGMVVFHRPELVLTFSEPVAKYEVDVFDNDHCPIRESSAVNGNKIIVKLKACAVVGFPPGHMHIHVTVNGVDIHHHLHVGKHH